MAGRIGTIVGRVGVWRALVLAVAHPMSVEGRARLYEGAARAFARLGVRRVRVNLNGARVYVDPRSYFALRHLIVSKWYDYDQVEAVRAAVPGGAEWTFIDVGANFGAWTFPLRDLFGAVLAFEPDPRCLVCLERSRDALGARNVEVVGEALSDTEGTVDLEMDDAHTGDSRIYAAASNGPDARRAVSVPMRTLDAVLEDRGAPPRRLFVKLDVQGVEPRVVRGMRATLAAVAEAVLWTELTAATLEAAGSSAEEYLDVLRGEGFSPARLEPGFPAMDWDDLPAWMASHKDCCFRLVRAAENA